MSKAIVKEIQVCGSSLVKDLEEACIEYVSCLYNNTDRPKISFGIELPDKTIKHITIRQDGEEVIAYGDFDGLPSMLDWAKEVKNE